MFTLFPHCQGVKTLISNTGTQIHLKHIIRQYSNMIRLFEGDDHAKKYALYRPTYPSEVYDTIVKFCRHRESKTQGGVAVDVACGSGQSTVPLKEHFQKVIGVDISQAQIDQAPQDAQVTFKTGQAENLDFLSDGSVDLITCAQGAHWLDRPRFYKEAERVLRPSGVLGLYGYGNVKLDIKEASDTISHFYSADLQGCWDKQRSHIDDHYASIYEEVTPFVSKSRDDSLMIRKEMQVSHFIGYIKSWSAYVTYKEKNPETQILNHLSERLQQIYQGAGENAADPKLTATWPVFILTARKSQT